MKSLSNLRSMGFGRFGPYGARGLGKNNVDSKLVNTIGYLTPKFVTAFEKYLRNQQSYTNNTINLRRENAQITREQQRYFSKTIEYKKEIHDVLQNAIQGADEHLNFLTLETEVGNSAISQEAKDFFGSTIKGYAQNITGTVLVNQMIRLLDSSDDLRRTHEYDIQSQVYEKEIKDLENNLKTTEEFAKKYRKDIMSSLSGFNKMGRGNGFSSLFSGRGAYGLLSRSLY